MKSCGSVVRTHLDDGCRRPQEWTEKHEDVYGKDYDGFYDEFYATEFGGYLLGDWHFLVY